MSSHLNGKSRQDQYLLNYVAEPRSILKNYQNTYHPRFIFSPKIGEISLKYAFCFILYWLMNTFFYHIMDYYQYSNTVCDSAVYIRLLQLTS